MARLPRLLDQPNLSNRRVARLRAAFWAVENALLTRTVGRARGNIAAADDRKKDVVNDRPVTTEVDRVRVLRWVFSRGAELVTCELSLSDDDACYELRTIPSSSRASRAIERFADVTAAFERQSTLEGNLVNDGWSLESYESTLVDRPRRRPIAI